MPGEQGVIAEAANILRGGGIIAYPTETVYGLGCLPDNDDALQRLIDIKGRDADKGFILLAADAHQLTPYTAILSDEQWQIIAERHERATTWTVPAAHDISALLTGKHSQIAIRLTSHPIVTALCKTSDSALISTSANFSGEAPPKTADTLPDALCARLDYILHGDCGDDPRPSRIVELATGKIVRQ